jgi:hypothetical protein
MYRSIPPCPGGGNSFVTSTGILTILRYAACVCAGNTGWSDLPGPPILCATGAKVVYAAMHYRSAIDR